MDQNLHWEIPGSTGIRCVKSVGEAGLGKLEWGGGGRGRGRERKVGDGSGMTTLGKGVGGEP